MNANTTGDTGFGDQNDKIGFAIARRLAQDGAHVLICSRKKENVEKAAEQLKDEGLSIYAMQCHVGNKEDRERLVAKALEVYGKIDILVCNAAVNPFVGPIFDTTEEMWTKRRCSDTDNDPDRCSVAVWSLESCHTDSSPATNDAGNQGKHRDGNQGKHRVTKRGPALSYPMFTLVTSEDIAGSVSHTPIQRCQQESSDEINFWTLFSDQRSPSRGLIVGRCHTGRFY
ncbi:unnamed protein product [Ranitomeya imitator]|uniref:Uncharacterized protein n=1 Tax=Ranitomeya imitator TaxID=111125 RepID=A0ABN9LED5_9NEOB|nr:unnamed protein product [Ranitomeya imitator]